MIIAASSSQAGPDQSLVRRIVIEGNGRIAAETIRSRLTLAEGAPYNAARAEASLQSLFATGQFGNVDIARRGADVVVRVVENPTLLGISFTGQRALTQTALEAEVKLSPGEAITEAKTRAAANRLRALYRSKGRAATVVTAALQPRPQNRADLVFTIIEADELKIAAIAFTGNAAFSAWTLRDVVSSTQTGIFDFLGHTSTLDAERLDTDRERLREHYRRNGYPDVAVAAPQTSHDPARQANVTVTFAIDEGDRFTFGPSRIESAIPGVVPDTLGKHVVTSPGKPFSSERIAATIQGLSEALTDLGQTAARVTANLQRDAAARVISVIYRIDNGSHTVVERIDVRGNKRTGDRVVRNALKLAEGGALNDVLVARDIDRVRRLGLFKTVKITPRPGSAAGKAVLEVELDEDDTTELSWGGGYSSSEGVTGDLSIVEKNLFGNGQSLAVSLAGSERRLEGSIALTEPHLFDSSVAGSVELFARDFDNTAAASYKTNRFGGSLRLATPVSDHISTGLGYTLSRATIYDVGDGASAAIKDAAERASGPSGSYVTSAIGTTTTYDDRNRRTLPTSGNYVTTTQDFAGIGGDARFVRSTAEARLYRPLGDHVTWVGRAEAGTIAGWGGKDVRLLDTFTKGGDSIRGFAHAGIGPRDLGSANLDALGGTSFVTVSSEVRFGLPGVPDSAGLKGAVFADAGSLFGTTRTASGLATGAAPSVRASVGAGLVWDSPVGPLGVGYAVPIVKQPFDKVQPLSFGVVP